MASLGKAIRDVGSLLPAALVRGFGRPVMLFFHGVAAHIDDSRAQSNHHDSATFSEIARVLRDNFDVLPLAELGRVLGSPRRHRRVVFLASDDGYANVLSEALPILNAFGLPFTTFVSTRHIDTAEPNPMHEAKLFHLFAKSGKYEIPNLGAITLDDSTREPSAESWGARLKALAAPRADEAVAAMRAALGEEKCAALKKRFRSDAFLDWDGVRALKAQGVEIGAHAHRHWPMHGAQSIAYLEEQARLSRARIEAEIGACRYFAFPFGQAVDVCSDAWRAVRDAGYEYAFTTLSGSLDASLNPFLLPRYGLQMHEKRLPSLVPILRTGNARLRAWQRRLS